VVTAALLLTLPTISRADTNVRPQLSLGSTVPMRWGSSITSGKALGGGLELEKSPRVSGVVSFEAHMLDVIQESDIVRQHSTVTAYAANFGVRLHAAQNSRIRPYAQAGLGARLSRGSYHPIAWYAGIHGEPAGSSYSWGTTAHLGVGLTTAGYHGAGLFFDASVEAMVHNPRDFALAPLRFGVTLP
jgi:hypothetical protein